METRILSPLFLGFGKDSQIREGGKGGLVEIIVSILIMPEKNMDNKPTEVGRWRKHLHY